MRGFDQEFLGALRAKIATEMKTIADMILQGIDDFDTYNRCVGSYAGLQRALNIADEVRKAAEEGTE